MAAAVDDVVVDVDAKHTARREEDWEKTCRICHLSSEKAILEGSELVRLGCDCKAELGLAHTHCAEAWFKIKGDRRCEICDAVARNVTGIVEDDRFMEQWTGRRRMAATNTTVENSSQSHEGRCARAEPFFKLLTICVLITFILPWFLHSNMF